MGSCSSRQGSVRNSNPNGATRDSRLHPLNLESRLSDRHETVESFYHDLFLGTVTVDDHARFGFSRAEFEQFLLTDHRLQSSDAVLKQRPLSLQLDDFSVCFLFPAHPSALSRLPAADGCDESICDSEGDDGAYTSCAICLSAYVSGDMLRVMPCLHRYHHECLAKWMWASHPSRLFCPLCRHDPRVVLSTEIAMVGGVE